MTPDEVLRRAQARVARLHPALRRAYAAYLRTLRQALGTDVVTRMLAGGAALELVLEELFASAAVVAAAKERDAVWAAAFADAGRWVTQDLPAWAPNTFNVRSAFAEVANQTWPQTLFTTQTQQVRDGLRAVVRAQLGGALDAGDAQRLLRDAVGLTPYDWQAVQNYRAELEGGRLGQALRRGLHDHRLDPTLRKTLAAGKPIPTGTVSVLVGRYTRNLRGLRAGAHTGTQAMMAYRLGSRSAVLQAVAGLDGVEVLRTWVTAQDERVRDRHRVMHGRTVRLDQPYQVPEIGAQMVPGQDEYGCRCVETYRIVRATT